MWVKRAIVKEDGHTIKEDFAQTFGTENRMGGVDEEVLALERQQTSRFHGGVSGQRRRGAQHGSESIGENWRFNRIHARGPEGRQPDQVFQLQPIWLLLISMPPRNHMRPMVKQSLHRFMSGRGKEMLTVARNNWIPHVQITTKTQAHYFNKFFLIDPLAQIYVHGPVLGFHPNSSHIDASQP